MDGAGACDEHLAGCEGLRRVQTMRARRSIRRARIGPICALIPYANPNSMHRAGRSVDVRATSSTVGIQPTFTMSDIL